MSPPTDTTALELRDVHAGYGRFPALFGVSFALARSEVVALVGTNGAGKTTVARVCSGLVSPTRGAVLLGGEPITALAPHRIARRGLVHIPEGRAVFAGLRVEEHLALWSRRATDAGRVTVTLDEAFAACPRLADRHRQRAGTLSGGEQRLLALARVVLDPPQVLVVDELSLGLAPLVAEEVYGTLARLRDTGCAVLVIEQQVGHALDLADRAVVLTRGRVAFAGPAADLRGHAGELTLGLRRPDPGRPPLPDSDPPAGER